MIAVADSGSTKCQWLICSENGVVESRVETKGFNPQVQDAEFIIGELMKSEELGLISKKINLIHFFGAGCSTPAMQINMAAPLRLFFPNAEVNVDHDLKAAATATFSGTPQVTCILGTGSNSCWYDGQSLSTSVPSLGFLLGDEGSGQDIGKRLLRGYFYGTMPKHLSRKFEVDFKISLAEVIDKTCRQPRANAFVASFSRFAADHRGEPFIEQALGDSFENFFSVHLPGYPRGSAVSFVGSIAWAYADILEERLTKRGFKMGVITRHPIEALPKQLIK